MNETWKKRIKYAAAMLIRMAVLMILLSIIIFVIADKCPGDPLRSYYGDGAERLSIEERQASEARLGLDQPLPVRYGRWVKNFVKGDLGLSYKYKQPVSEVIGRMWQNTLALGGLAYVLTFGFAVWLGKFCALHEDGVADRVICKIGVISNNIPAFFMALLLILIFSVNLRILPAGGAYSYGMSGSLADRLYHMVLPVTVLVLEHLWYYAYMIRNKLVEETRQDYVLLCKAEGMSRKAIISKSCMRNILPSLLVMMAISVPHILGGTYVVETVFSYPGLGTLSFESAMYKDYNMLMALCMITGLAVLVFNMMAKVINEFIDPRMQYEKTAEEVAGYEA